jgi:hypothetical protein
MKKKLLIVISLLVLSTAGSLAVWANEQAAAQPGCDKCPKMQAEAKPCDEKVCDKHAQLQAEGKKGTDKGCEKCAKLQPVVKKSCCDKNQPEKKAN